MKKYTVHGRVTIRPLVVTISSTVLNSDVLVSNDDENCVVASPDPTVGVTSNKVVIGDMSDDDTLAFTTKDDENCDAVTPSEDELTNSFVAVVSGKTDVRSWFNTDRDDDELLNSSIVVFCTVENGVDSNVIGTCDVDKLLILNVVVSIGSAIEEVS